MKGMCFSTILVGLAAVLEAEPETSSITCGSEVDAQPVLVSDVLEALSKEVFEMQKMHPLLQSLRMNLTDLTDTIQRGNADQIEDRIKSLRRWFARFTIHHGVFSMFFKDLNNIIFRYSDQELKNPEWTDNQLQLAELINEHTREDGTHFRWALADFVTLGLDQPARPYSESVLFWYNDEMESARIAGYDIIKTDARYSTNVDPLARYVLIETTEFTGQHIFGLISAVYKEFNRAIDTMLDQLNSDETNDTSDIHRAKSAEIIAIRNQCKLIYSGHEHSEAENGGLELESGRSAETLLDGFTVSMEDRNRLMKMGREVIDAISVLWQGSHEFSLSMEGPDWTQF